MRTPPSPVLDPGDIASQLDGWVVPDKMLSAALADRLASLISGGGLPAMLTGRPPSTAWSRALRH